MAVEYVSDPKCLKCEWSDIKMTYNFDIDKLYCTCTRCKYSWVMRPKGNKDVAPPQP